MTAWFSYPALMGRLYVLVMAFLLIAGEAAAQDQRDAAQASIAQEFDGSVKGLLRKFCVDCHSVDNMESGIRVDHLEGSLPERSLKLWEAIRRNLDEATMPPKDSDQPKDAERAAMIDWIDRGFAMARSRPDEKNGSTRRLTVAQYQNTLRDLLGIEEHLTDILPPDAVSADGFLNNGQTLELSPLLLEAYFNIAEKALDLCIVDENAKPQIQNFRMDLGAQINPEPCPDKLILGALSHLLKNDDFVVTQLTADKPFAFDPFFMRTKYRFIEGYQGNDTVRGWREYDSIYHSVFACMRGTDGYPKGKAYETVPAGLLLRPAIPSAELFQIESTYGPRANFKISLRELPDSGNFRVTVRAAKYEDGLLLDTDVKPASSRLPKVAEGRKPSGVTPIIAANATQPQTVNVEHAGVYQVDVSLQKFIESTVKPDDSHLAEGLIGAWPLDGDTASRGGEKEHSGELVGGAKFVESPFGQAVSFDGADDAVVTPRDDSMNVGESEFTVAAWIRPTELRQGGIVYWDGTATHALVLRHAQRQRRAAYRDDESQQPVQRQGRNATGRHSQRSVAARGRRRSSRRERDTALHQRVRGRCRNNQRCESRQPDDVAAHRSNRTRQPVQGRYRRSATVSAGSRRCRTAGSD